MRAVGETGLDYFRTGEDGRAAQEASFRAHIELAKRHGKALVIHDRDAHDDVLRVLEDEGAPDRVVFHCFSGDAAMAEHCVDRGWYLSFAGTVTFKNAAGAARGAARSRRRTGCWSRPTRRTSRRCPTAAGRTRRTWCRTRCARWPRCAGSRRTPWPPPVAANTEAAFGIW